MNAQEQSSLAVVDTELFKIYAHYQLCRVKKGIVGSSEAAEKKAIVQILEACQHINADTFHALVSDLLKHSVPVQPFYEGGLTTLFHSTTASPLNHIHAGRKRASKDRSSAATSQEHDMDRNYSSEQSESEESDDEGPAIITPKRKRARSTFNTGSRQDSSTSGQKYSLSSLSINALNYLSTVPQKTKQDLFKRMKTTTDSFRIDYSISQEGKNPVKSFQIQFTERFPPQSIYHQCQTNLVGYRLGQIINREALVFPIMAQEENKRLYFAQGLNNTKPTSKVSEFTKYCKALTRMVEETGVYCLFMPEVVPPTFYRRAGEDLLKTTIDCMQKKFSQFANIASIDENGDLFIADSEDMGDEAGGGADEAVDKNKDTNESEVDEAVDKNKDTNESEVDDARQDVKTEAVECSADKRQEVNEDTPSWHTMEW